MAIYQVFIPPGGSTEKARFVRDGFSMPAFLFTLFWTLWHRMWLVAALLLAVFAGLSIAASRFGLDPALASVIQAAIALLLGLEAANLRSFALRRAGHAPAGLVEASTLESAELAFFMAQPSQEARPQAASFRPAPDDMLNLFGNV